MLRWLQGAGWHARIRRVAASVVVVFALLFVWLRWTAVDGVDCFGNVLAPDFGQFYVAGQLAASGEIGRVYDEPFFFARVNALFGQPPGADSYPFLYPPFAPWLCVPLSWLPYPIAASLYMLVSCAVVVAVGRWVARYFLSDRDSALDAVWLLVASLPVIRCVLYGQNGWLSLAVAWGGFWLWQRRCDWACGLVFALGAFKPQLFFGLWIWLLLVGSNRARLGLVLGGTMWLFLGCVGTWDGMLWLEWIRAVTHVRDSRIILAQMHSWWSAFALWNIEGGALAVVRGVTWGALAMSWAVVVWVMSGRSRRASMRGGVGEGTFMLTLMGWVWVTPRFAQYDALILYPVLVWFWSRPESGSEAEVDWKRLCIICFVSSFYLGDLFSIARIPFITLLGVGIWIRLCIETMHSRR